MYDEGGVSRTSGGQYSAVGRQPPRASAYLLGGALGASDPGVESSQRLAMTGERAVRVGDKESEARSGEQVTLDLQREAPELGAICGRHVGETVTRPLELSMS